MIRLEFTVPGIPRSPRAKSASNWQTSVADSARRMLPIDWVILATPVSIVIIYFHRGEASGIDVDNMSKPILDAIEGIVILDDQLVEQLTSRRTQLYDGLVIQDVPPVLAEALDNERDFVLIRVEDAPIHGVLP